MNGGGGGGGGGGCWLAAVQQWLFPHPSLPSPHARTPRSAPRRQQAPAAPQKPGQAPPLRPHPHQQSTPIFSSAGGGGGSIRDGGEDGGLDDSDGDVSGRGGGGGQGGGHGGRGGGDGDGGGDGSGGGGEGGGGAMPAAGTQQWKPQVRPRGWPKLQARLFVSKPGRQQAPLAPQKPGQAPPRRSHDHQQSTPSFSTAGGGGGSI